ncbi:unnamed protein product [Cyclocybe aegerita]|uniref:Uncharacterized protein n=1 Tax=Cyclocybe aegerita TaxID=1973307 RepID=A0A8S0W3A5_CYCAE|nr:unnamed protein product [Cyclocybe aegerita]
MSNLPEVQRYRKLVEMPGKTPSAGSKTGEYNKGQSAPLSLSMMVALRLILQLRRFLKSSTASLDIKDVQELDKYTAKITPGNETYRNARIRRILARLPGDMHEEANDDMAKSDGVFAIVIDDVRIPIAIMELKKELGNGGCDPSSQAGLSMRRAWIQTDVGTSSTFIFFRSFLTSMPFEQRAAIRDKCCCPTFLLAGGGAWLSVMGAVLTDKVVVQRLTDMMWLAESSTEEASRVYNAARVLSALRVCLKTLSNYYQGLHQSDIPPVTNTAPHPRFYSYPALFTDGETARVIRFQFLRAMEEDDDTCVMFQAKILDDPSDLIIVKFVSRYGTDVHRFRLAEKGYAPRLRYHDALRHSKPLAVSPAVKKAPAGLFLETVKMVAMDYVMPAESRPLDAHPQLRQAFPSLIQRATCLATSAGRTYSTILGIIRSSSLTLTGLAGMTCKFGTIREYLQTFKSQCQ